MDDLISREVSSGFLFVAFLKIISTPQNRQSICKENLKAFASKGFKSWDRREDSLSLSQGHKMLVSGESFEDSIIKTVVNMTQAKQE